MENIKKLKLQKNIGIIIAALGVLFLIGGILHAFGAYFPILINPLLTILMLAIGYWLTYKAEKDIKKIKKK